MLSLKRPIIFFDLETTGLDPVKDRIVEIACVKQHPDGLRETWTRRINPGMPIPEEVIAIHGIRDEDVRDAPEFRQIAQDLWQWMKGCDLGGYNSARFDLPVLVEEFSRTKVKADFSTCRMVDVQHIFYKMEPRTLTAAYQFFCNKKLENAHSAEADILATMEVLEAQLNRYDQQLSRNVEELTDFLNGGEGLVDYAQKMVLRDGRAVFNFGKFKGRPVEEVLTEEPNYYDWMMSRDFPAHTKQKLTEILTTMKLGKKMGKQS